MKYNQPYGISDPNGPYINGNPSTGQMGSIPPAASIEYPQRELVNFITDAALVPDNADLHQLAKSVQSGRVIYGVDSGSVNVVSIALTPPLAAYADGLFVWVRIANTNTGPSVLSINGLAGKNIVRRGGSVLQAGDLPGGYIALFVYNGPHGNFEYYGAAYSAGSGFLPILIANTILYVDAAIGDDALYDGTAAVISGPHGPYKTIMRAINETFKYGPSVYTMTINVAAGNYNESVVTPSIVGPTTIVNGAGKNLTFINGAAAGPHTILSSHSNQVTVQNCCVKTTNVSGGNSCIVSTTGAFTTIKDIAIGGPGSATNGYLIDALGGQIFTAGNIDILAGTSCYAVLVAYTGGNLVLGAGTINHLGTINCNVYATASSSSSISTAPPGSGNDPVFGNPGFVTGQKFSTALNGVINTQGHSINYFPGTIAGGNGTGGQYG